MKTIRILTLISNILGSGFGLLMSGLVSLIVLISAISTGMVGSFISFLMFLASFLLIALFLILHIVHFAKQAKGQKSLCDVFSMILAVVIFLFFGLILLLFAVGLNMDMGYEMSEQGITIAVAEFILGALSGLISFILSVVAMVNKGKAPANMDNTYTSDI